MKRLLGSSEGRALPAMFRISSLAIVLALTLIVPASADDTQPAKTPSQAPTQSACKLKCQSQYTDYKECPEGVAPMHSACEIYDQCLRNCD